MVQEMKRRGCKGVGGIWDEMSIKEGIVLCKRTGELVGFEDMAYSPDLNMKPEDPADKGDEEDKDKHDSASESSDSCYIIY